MLYRIPLVESSARRRDLYLTTHNTHQTEIFRRPAGLKSAIPAKQRPQTHALHWAATGTGIRLRTWHKTGYNIFIKHWYILLILAPACLSVILVEVMRVAEGFRIVLLMGPKWVRSSLLFSPEERDWFFLRNDVVIHIWKKIENLRFHIPFSSLLPAANADPTMADYWGIFI